MAEQDKFEDKTPFDVATYLKENGIPDVTCEKFEDQEIDGEAFLELTEEDINKLTDKMGVTKISRLMKGLRADVVTPSTSLTLTPTSRQRGLTPDDSDYLSSLRRSSSTGPLTPPPASPLSPISPLSDDRSSVFSSISSKSKTKTFKIPDKWRPTIMACISAPTEEEKVRMLIPKLRNEIVRDLVTQMYSYWTKPNSSAVTEVAKMLVEKYPFMEDQGTNVTGYGSWEKKIIDRLNNTRKRGASECTDSPPAKKGRPKLVTKLARYPQAYLAGEGLSDDISFERNMEAMKMERDSPRKDQLLLLMKLTYPVRRQFILSDSAEVTATAILQKYQALSLVPVLQQEIDIILAKKDVVKSGIQEWKGKWVQGIINYAQSVHTKAAELANKEAKMLYAGDEEEEEKTALNFLCTLLAKKSIANALVYIYEEREMADEPEDVARCTPTRNAPRIACFKGPTTEPQYFLYVEQKVLCSVATFSKAFILWFVSHYIFNLEYCKHTKEIALFMQEFIFDLPARVKKTSTYLTVTTGIQSFICN